MSVALLKGSTRSQPEILSAVCSDFQDASFCCMELLKVFVEASWCDETGKKDKQSIN